MMLNSLTTTVASPLGPLTITQQADGAVIALQWGGQRATTTPTPSALAAPVVQALDDYFAGASQAFKRLKLAPAGTPFQQKVWQAMQQIPHGQVLTYGAMAQQLQSSPRAVGGACGANPIPLLIPCHRVVGRNGQLTGYSGGAGVETKAFLLNHEQQQRKHHV